MRSKKALINTIIQLALEITTVLSGFIVPRLIISAFGSETNGLVVSITQFFGYLSVLQSGIGGVAKAALYKPLADNDTATISSLVKSIESFFRKIGYISIVYMFVLMFLFPSIIYPGGGFIETALLVIIIWLGIFCQYYFGLTYQFLLQADQRYYIYSFTQILVVIVNTVLSVLLIRLGFGILGVKLVGAIVFLIRPIILSIYCKRKYAINQNAEPNNLLIKQRWDGFGHTIAYFIHSKTDVFVLTIFSTLNEVSVYSVYASVTSGLSLLLNTVATSVQAAFGNMIARKENDLLKHNYHSYVCVNNAIVMVVFSTAMLSIIPFMTLYTASFEYNGYIDRKFACMLIFAEATYCIRMPYQTIVLAAGHYKQTRNGAFSEAGINLLASICLVQFLGIKGVAIGTLLAMMFRTIQYIEYLSKNIVSENPYKQYAWVIIDMLYLLISYAVSLYINRMDIVLNINSYFEWCIFALAVFVFSLVLVLIITIIIDRNNVLNIIEMFVGMLKKRQSSE